MLTDSYIVPQCAIGPGSFGGLMALYESNFIKFYALAELVGEHKDSCYLSVTSADCDLYLMVDSVAKYTRVLRMTYLFESDESDDHNGPVADPDLGIRLYLDARMAEVVGWADHHRHVVLNDLERRFKRELDRRWARNMMLSKWLDYLLEMGHSFAVTDQAPKRRGAVAVDSMTP
jgi:uncharacterized protein YqiB (DUF1249 family)